MYGPKRAKRDGGSSAPSRTAAIGSTRVARIAGRIAAISVTTMPTSERDDDRARREDGPDLRQVDAERDEERVQELREPEARGRGRSTDAITPITNASSTTDQ